MYYLGNSWRYVMSYGNPFNHFINFVAFFAIKKKAQHPVSGSLLDELNS